MKNNILQQWLDKWDLIPSDGAKVLKINKSKVSEYLSDKSDRTLPDYVAAHIETFDLLAKTKAKNLIKQRLQ
jgi:predicted transcriptional regulator